MILEDRNGIKTVYSYDSRNNATQIAIGSMPTWTPTVKL